MKYLNNVMIFALALLTVAVLLSCNKSSSEPPPGQSDLLYGDSIIYLRNQPGDYIVTPAKQRPGTYSGYPEGIEIDEKTGAINVSKSETGLRYKITHTAPDGTVANTMLVLSGITFPDKYYYLSRNDSIAFPVYNAHPSRALPLAGSTFDEGNAANTSGCSVRTNNGQINLAETIRNGVFGNTPKNDVRKDFEIVYRLNDGSNKAKNKLKVRLYWYNTIADVPADLLETLNDRTEQGVFFRSGGGVRVAKPRPPCVIIIAN